MVKQLSGIPQKSILVDLPESYLVWFSQKEFPEGKPGEMLPAVYEIKLNGLEYLFKDADLKENQGESREIIYCPVPVCR